MKQGYGTVIQSSVISRCGSAQLVGIPGATTGSPASMRRPTSKFNARVCASRSCFEENPWASRTAASNAAWASFSGFLPGSSRDCEARVGSR